MDWKHAYLKPNKNGFLQWRGDLPDYDKELVIYTNGYFHINNFIFEDDGNAELEGNFSADDFYWCELEAPDAVTVEKEKSYTVEIPNPHAKGHNKIYLCKDGNTGKVYLCKGNFNPKKNKNLRLTEAEIRKDFDWAWQWAEEVTE